MKLAPFVVVAGGAALVLWPLLATAGNPGTCYQLKPGMRYEFTYNGPRRKIKSVLGDCWNAIYYLEIYDSEEDDWRALADPEHDYLESGSLFAVMVQSPCKICF